MIANTAAANIYEARVYRPSTGWKAGMVVLAALTGVPSALGIWYFTLGAGVKEIHAPMVMVALCGLFLLLAVVLLANLRVTRVVLGPQGVVYYDLFSRREIAREEIKGYRTETRAKGSRVTILVPRFADRKSFEIPEVFAFDATYAEWLAQFPNLDVETAIALQEEIENNPVLGATAEQRQSSLRLARRLSTILTIATCLASGWGWFYPRPYRVVIFTLMAVPWMGILLAAKYKGLFRIDEKRNDPHPNVAFAFIFPGIILALRVINDFEVVGWQRPLMIAIFIDLLLCAAAYKVDSSLMQQKVTLVLLLLLGTAYGFGAGLELNALLDRAAPQVYPTKVIGKRISHGKTTSYYLELDAWGRGASPDEVTVSRSFYDSFKKGDPVCVLLRPGALAIEWYVVRRCQ